MSSPLPSLNALRAFESAARHLNYRRASEELHVSPGAVKQLVAKLEESLGQRLLVRQGRSLALTPAGAAGLRQLSPAFAEIAAAVEAMRPGTLRRRLILSVEPSFATAWLVPRLEDFRRRHPGIDVLVDTALQLVDLERGDADVAIRFWKGGDPDLLAHRLVAEELSAYCSPALVQGENAITRLEDLERVTLLHWDLAGLPWAGGTRRWVGWAPWLHRLGAGHIRPGEGLRFSDYNLAIQAAIGGQGVMLGSLPLFRDLVDAGLLVRPFAESVATDLGYDLVTTARAATRPEVAAFSDWITAIARR
jgi:LysR family transcriptional regulator, glycine cleavage system transcriptional activator